jgi:N6-L-threonylcarbamoyladenine synthase
VLPAVALVASGGHTSLFLVESVTRRRFLGGTTDDAAGEAFDKVASILRLGYPGGPAIDAAARNGNPRAVRFPRTWLRAERLQFSFSGIKTAVLYHCLGQNASKEQLETAEYDPAFVADVAASFQEAVVDVLVAKTLQAAERFGAEGLILGGGVAANARLREKLQDAADRHGQALKIAPRRYCTDNAVMIAGYAFHLAREDRFAPLSVEASPHSLALRNG